MADHAHEHGPKSGTHPSGTSHSAASGTMDIRDKEKTFEGFIRMVMWGAGIAIGILIFLALANG